MDAVERREKALPASSRVCPATRTPTPLTRLFPDSLLLQREFLIDNLQVRVVMIRWTGLAPWEFELCFPGRGASTFLAFSCMGRCVLLLYSRYRSYKVLEP